MASDIWLRTFLIVREETHCRHMGYSFRLAARVLLYAPSHRQYSTYHSLCYTSRGGKEGMSLFNDTFNTFYVQIYGVRPMVLDHSVREETCCSHMGYSFQLTASVLLYASSHIQALVYKSWNIGWNEK